MITEKQLRNLSKLSNDDLHKILQEIVTELLVPMSVEKWKEITGDKRTEKSIYNAIDRGDIKYCDIAGHKFPYVNW
jgi:hypothetical protein